MPQRLRCPLLILALGLTYFHDLVLHPTAILSSDHSDFLAIHIPDKTFLVQSFQETGEIPLWCPYKYGGSPFVHDIQLGAFYPPHIVLYLLPPAWVGTGLSWLVVAHVVLAGLLMYAYAGRQGLSEPGRLVAAIGYMFAGRWLLHLLGGGHYVLVGMAWLPLLLLLYEGALARRKHGIWLLVPGSFVLALMLLGTQPQWTFYSGLFVGLWTFRTVWESAGSRWESKGIWRQGMRGPQGPWGRFALALAGWFCVGTVICGLGLSLSAIQLFPTWEAATLSSRGGGAADSTVLEAGLRSLLFLVGPWLATDPPNLMWEDRGGLCLLWLTAAVLAGVSLKGRVRYLAIVTLILVVFALGAAYLVQWLPGFRLFRSPSRMFVIVGFPVALLAGYATDALFVAEAEDLRRRARAILGRLAIALAILAGGFTARLLLEGKTPQFHPYWFTLLLTVPAMFALLKRAHPLLVRHGLAVWIALLLADSWALTLPLVETRVQGDVFKPSPSVTYLAQFKPGEGRVLDRDGLLNPDGSPLGTGAHQAMLHHIEALRGYTPLDYLRYKEYLQFIGGSDEPLTAFSSPLTFPVISDFPLDNRRLLDLLGVRFFLAPNAKTYVTAVVGASADPAGCGPLALLGPLYAVTDVLPPGADGWEVVLEDAQPTAFDLNAGGVRNLPPYTVYRNNRALDRAFVVHKATVLPERSEVLGRLSSTEFTKEVLLETDEPVPTTGVAEETPRKVQVTKYLPNQVTITVSDGPAGYLVLTDPWYPGWVARFDGTAEGVSPYRADFLFRAVAVPEGTHTIVFRFEPRSYQARNGGRNLSLVSLALLGLVLVVLGLLAPIWYRIEARKKK